MNKTLSILFALPILLSAADSIPSLEGKHYDSEMDALRKWLKEKRLVSVKELGGDLSISGEIRVEGQYQREVHNGDSMLSGKYRTATTKPWLGWDSEVSVTMDYRSDRTWGTIKLKYDNAMGSNSGTTDKIAMDKAYFGGKMYVGNTYSFDGELGRRNLGHVFESRIEFASLYDGGLLRFSKASEAIGDFTIAISAFLVNDKTDHYAFIGEAGMLRIGNTGFFTKYSFIDWKKHYGKIEFPEGSEENISSLDEHQLKQLYFNYMNSQLIVGYMCTPEQIHRLIKVYAAGLYNHAAIRTGISKHQKLNWACYVGASIGKVLQKGDWALDANYQYVLPQSIPDFDCSGIRRGNYLDVGLYTSNIGGTGHATTIDTAVGSCNYKGFQVEFLYAITNNLILLNNIKKSWTIKNIGPSISYFQYELELNYSF